MSFEALPERLAQVRAEIARLASQPVTIVAVTKGFGADAVRAAAAAGLEDIGENRVQEAVEKQDALGSPDSGVGGRWHLIGHLQRNKAKLVPDRKSTRLNSSHVSESRMPSSAWNKSQNSSHVPDSRMPSSAWRSTLNSSHP